MRLWGHKKEGTVLRFLSPAKVKRIKHGKDVFIRVQGIVVCLTQERGYTAVQRRIERYKDKIKQLEKITKGGECGWQSRHIV